VPPNPPFYDAYATHAIFLDQEEQTKGLDTIQHEYGHFIMHDVMYDFAINSPIQPAVHYLWQEYNENIAWTEGWANFFALIVQDDIYYSNDDFENKHWNSQGYIYNGQEWVIGDCEDGDAVEGRVAGALWDLYDKYPNTLGSTNEPYDQVNLGFMSIWKIINSYSPSITTFSGFWDRFKQDKSSQQIIDSARALYQNTIAYDELRFDLKTIVLPQAGGSIDQYPSLPNYTCNRSVTLTAIEDNGCDFDHWTNDLGSSNPLNIIMDEDKNITAIFKDKENPVVDYKK
jgi:hypothetical protein